MKILVAGCGSIGSRHIRNLMMLGMEVVACDTSEEKLLAATSLYSVAGYKRFDEALAAGPAGVIIATPSSAHYEQAFMAISHGFPVFVEKPLSESLAEAAALEKRVAEKKGVLLNGLNMRFHPSIMRVKEMLDENLIGPVYSIRAVSGYYLPDWHPASDYRESYSAKKSLGGGVLLDGIHEIDYIKWFFGNVQSLFCMGGKVSSLDIDTEDMVELLMKFESGVHAELHINYLNRTRIREFLVIGEKGIIRWDSNEGAVKYFDSTEQCWKIYREPFEFNINDTYVLEMQHFINCMEGKETSLNDAKEGRGVVEIVECSKRSLETKMPVKVKDGASGQ